MCGSLFSFFSDLFVLCLDPSLPDFTLGSTSSRGELDVDATTTQLSVVEQQTTLHDSMTTTEGQGEGDEVSGEGKGSSGVAVVVMKGGREGGRQVGKCG